MLIVPKSKILFLVKNYCIQITTIYNIHIAVHVVAVPLRDESTCYM